MELLKQGYLMGLGFWGAAFTVATGLLVAGGVTLGVFGAVLMVRKKANLKKKG